MPPYVYLIFTTCRDNISEQQQLKLWSVKIKWYIDLLRQASVQSTVSINKFTTHVLLVLGWRIEVGSMFHHKEKY